MSKIIVITGASSGFGALTARALAHAGHTVYAGMRDTAGRNAPAVADAAAVRAEHGVDLRTVELDVLSTRTRSMPPIATIIAEAGALDVVVHNAGHMVLGPAEAFTPEQFAALYDINVLSAPSGSTAPPCRTCASSVHGLLLWVGSLEHPRRHAALPRAVLRGQGGDGRARRRATPPSWRASASRPRSSCRARSPPAPTTSRTPARRRSGRRRDAYEKRYAGLMDQVVPAARRAGAGRRRPARRSRVRSPAWSAFPRGRGRSACTSTPPTTARASSTRSATGSARSSTGASGSRTSSVRRPPPDPALPAASSAGVADPGWMPTRTGGRADRSHLFPAPRGVVSTPRRRFPPARAERSRRRRC